MLYIASNGRIRDEFEGRGRDIIVVPPWYLPGDDEENKE
jgi:hypothetical protein